MRRVVMIMLHLSGYILIGSVTRAINLYRRNVDPVGNLSTTPPAPLSLVYAWATIIALTLYGAAFLQGNCPNWLGYLLLVSIALLALGLVSFSDRFYASFPPLIFYLLTLIIGIVALRQCGWRAHRSL
jgi:hypothetical protein